MCSPNKHIEDYLDYYCNLSTSPEFAVLIKGPWGSGKTWFINNYTKKLEANNEKYIYVSLYGASSFSEIEDAFFQQLHPLLASKGMTIASKILKGALKATIRVDLDDDNKPDGSISVSAPGMPIKALDTSSYILLFDDLERCEMDIGNLLGYINNFVEHQGNKVIIIANEQEITAQDSSENKESLKYKRIKEKLIGKTFQVSPDIQEALSNFLLQVENEGSRKILKTNMGVIIDIYHVAQYENLRHLKQSLLDFDRFIASLPKVVLSNNDLLVHLLKVYLCFSFEIKSGNLSAEDIQTIRSSYYTSLLDRDKKIEKTPAEKFIQKYSALNISDLLLTEKQWVNLLDKGIWNSDSITESLYQSTYLQDKKTEDWVKLWHFHDLEDNEFQMLLNKVSEKLSSMEYESVPILKHVTGLLLTLANLGLYEKDSKSIVDLAKQHMDFLKDENKIKFTYERSGPDFSDNDSWGGLQFSGLDLEDFKDFQNYVTQVTNIAELESLPEEGIELINVLMEDSQRFFNIVTAVGGESHSFFRTPIFNFIDIEQLISVLDKLSPEDFRKFTYALKERYEFRGHLDKLIKDCSGLEVLAENIGRKIKANPNNPSSLRYGNLHKIILTSISNLKEKSPC